MSEVLLAEGPPAPPSEKRCLTFDLLLHIMEVVHSLQEPREGSSSDDDFAPPRRRTHNTFLGRIDGMGPGPALGGGHRFTGPGSGSVGGFQRQLQRVPVLPASPLQHPTRPAVVPTSTPRCIPEGVSVLALEASSPAKSTTPLLDTTASPPATTPPPRLRLSCRRCRVRGVLLRCRQPPHPGMPRLRRLRRCAARCHRLCLNSLPQAWRLWAHRPHASLLTPRQPWHAWLWPRLSGRGVSKESFFLRSH